MLPNAEHEIWDRFKEGDRKAFEQIYNTHFSSLYNYGFRFCGNSPQAKDAVHQLFVKLWDHKEKLSTPVSVRHYLIKSLRNILLDHFKTDICYKALDAGDTNFSEQASEFLLIQENISDVQHQQLRKAISTLTKRQREAIYLKFFENLSYDEVSSAMSLTVNSVYNLISKAIEVLRKNTPYVNLMLLFSLMS
ncbi:sigma-70 family RNA polymerase sigma factor [Catalinimonas sp. 4WD22]|uniref:RNA polymerase sigma factor n=1 Tax=Catalinimonas locisalis TaxID=3133978 RepID=UPI003100C894